MCSIVIVVPNAASQAFFSERVFFLGENAGCVERRSMGLPNLNLKTGSKLTSLRTRVFRRMVPVARRDLREHTITNAITTSTTKTTPPTLPAKTPTPIPPIFWDLTACAQKSVSGRENSFCFQSRLAAIQGATHRLTLPCASVCLSMDDPLPTPDPLYLGKFARFIHYI